MDQPDIPVDRLLDLSGKVALVTGAGRGIGAGIVRRLAEAGAAVAVHYRGGREAAEALVATVTGDGGKAMAIHGELADRAAVESAFAAIGETLGPVDILVNNAARQTHSTIADMEPDEWRDTLATNLDAVFNTTRVATDAMVARG
ncbi:MAG: SDR family NAD(P)-dependent oxidoreductase, partial [Bauldia litoralis]